MIVRSTLLLCICVVGMAGCGGAARESASKACDSIPEDAACRVSFRALASDPASFNGRKVRVEGYLGVSAMLFVLSSSKELFDAGVSDEVFVRIRGPMESQQNIYDQHAYTWVSVTGTFRTREKDGTTYDLLIGELHAPIEARSLRPPIPQRRETFDEAALDLGDLESSAQASRNTPPLRSTE